MSNPTSNFGWQMPTATDLVTDLPADFEVFGQAVDTDFVDLLGGTTGQILSKTSATDLDFTWIANDQGDITGVTAGNGITVTSPTGPVPTVAINTAVTADLTTAQTLTNKKLSDSTTTIVDVADPTKAIKFDVAGTTAITGTIATAFTTAKTVTIPDTTGTVALTNGVINNTLTTATGDIIYASAANTPARLGIGTTGQVLNVSGGIPAWATASSGLTLITRQTFTTVTTTTTSFDGCFSSSYRNYMISFDNLDSSVNAAFLYWQYRYAGPTTQAGSYYGACWNFDHNGTTTGTTSSGASQLSVIKIGSSGSASAGTQLNLYVNGVGNSSQKPALSGLGSGNTNTGPTISGVTQDTARTYTGFILSASSGNISGTVSVYGLAIA